MIIVVESYVRWFCSIQNKVYGIFGTFSPIWCEALGVEGVLTIWQSCGIPCYVQITLIEKAISTYRYDSFEPFCAVRTVLS